MKLKTLNGNRYSKMDFLKRITKLKLSKDDILIFNIKKKVSSSELKWYYILSRDINSKLPFHNNILISTNSLKFDSLRPFTIVDKVKHFLRRNIDKLTTRDIILIIKYCLYIITSKKWFKH